MIKSSFIFRRSAEMTKTELTDLERCEVRKSKFKLTFQGLPRPDQFDRLLRKIADVESLIVEIECRGGLKKPECFPLDLLLRLPKVVNLVLLVGWTAKNLNIIRELKGLKHIDISPGKCQDSSLLPLAANASLDIVYSRGLTKDLHDTLSARRWREIYLEDCRALKGKFQIKAERICFAGASQDAMDAAETIDSTLVSIAAMRNLEDLSIFDRVEGCESAHLCQLPNVQTLAFGKAAAHIRHLWIQDLTKLRLGQEVRDLRKLEYLRLTGSPLVSRDQLAHLEALPKLTKGRVVIKVGKDYDPRAVNLRDDSDYEHLRHFYLDVKRENCDS